MDLNIQLVKWNNEEFNDWNKLAKALAQKHSNFSKKYKVLCKIIFSFSKVEDYLNLIQTRMYGTHRLKEQRKDEWVLNVSKNQRLVLKFIPPNKPSEKNEVVNELGNYH